MNKRDQQHLPLRHFRGIIFLLVITPLGLGSAFPFTLLMAVSLALLWRKWKLMRQSIY